jgi:hypothetical protein
MRLHTLLLGIATVAFAQSPGTTVQQSGACSVNTSGNANNTTLICNAIDPKLAHQLLQIVNGTKASTQALKDVSDKLDVLIKELAPLPPRRVKPEDKPAIIANLAGRPAKVRVGAIINDPEAYDFAQDWYDVLKAANWEMADPAVLSFAISGRPWTGVQMAFHGEPLVPGGAVQISNDSAMGHLLLNIAKIIAVRDIAADPKPDNPEGLIYLQIGPHPK